MQSIDSWVLDSVSDIDTAYIIVITDIYSGVVLIHSRFFYLKIPFDTLIMKCS